MGYEAPTQRKSRKTHGHKTCPRCGENSFNVKTKKCVCGYGTTSKTNKRKNKVNRG